MFGSLLPKHNQDDSTAIFHHGDFSHHTTSQKVENLPVGFIAVSLGLNWVLMLYFGAKLGRYKIMLYPLMFVVNPFFNWLYMVYGIFTAGQRTWGGPRADAGAASVNTSPQAAIEHAEATGDDLNVVPESFKPAVAAVTRKKSVKNKTVLPSDDLDGRFAAAELMPGGWYKQNNDSQLTVPEAMHGTPSSLRRGSVDSIFTSTSANLSIYMPRRVESIVAPDDASAYHRAQAMQRPAGGAMYSSSARQEYNHSRTKGEYTVSVVSDDDDNNSLYGSGHHHHDRVASGSSEHTERQPYYPTDAVPLRHQLTVPARTQRAHERQTSQIRTGRSPLARKSFMKSAADDEAGTTMTDGDDIGVVGRDWSDQRLGLMDPRAQSPIMPETETTRQQQDKEDEKEGEATDGDLGRRKEKKQRRRLSKSRPASE